MIVNPTTNVSVRIKFGGTAAPETKMLLDTEYDRLRSEWSAYLGGSGQRGGEYTSEDGVHLVLLSLNFDQIAYIESGKVY